LWFFFVDFQANMDGAVNGMKARIQALQGKLKNKKLKQRSAVEDELKHLVEQMGAAQHDIDENQGKTRGLLSQKQKLTNKINAKKSSLTKFRSGAL
jgi:chromosome segregation ATPase